MLDGVWEGIVVCSVWLDGISLNWELGFSYVGKSRINEIDVLLILDLFCVEGRCCLF